MNRVLSTIALSAVTTLIAFAEETPASGKIYTDKFVWGASISTNVDMTFNDLSTLGLEGYVGCQTGAIDLIGAGVSYDVAINVNSRIVPVYAIVRSNFMHRPSLCFGEIRGGLSINYTTEETYHTGGYFSIAAGINLARAKTFNSYLTVGYALNGGCVYTPIEGIDRYKDLHSVVARIGITF